MTEKESTNKNENIEADSKFKPIKIVLVGPASSGAKTSLIHRFIEGTFTQNTLPTIGAYFGMKKIEVEGKLFKLEIWGLPIKQTKKIYYYKSRRKYSHCPKINRCFGTRSS